MSLVDDAESVKGATDELDPSARSGRHPSRISRPAVMYGGFILAALMAMGVGIAVWGFQHGNVVATPAVAAAATPPPAAATPAAGDRERNKQLAKATANPNTQGGGSGDGSGDGTGTGTGDGTGTGTGSGSGTGTGSGSGAATVQPTPSVAERIEAMHESQTLANAARRLSEQDRARDGALVVTSNPGPFGAGSPPPGASATEPGPPPPTPPVFSPPPVGVAPPGAPSAPTSTSPPAASPYAIREGDAIDAILQPNVDTDRKGIVVFYIAHDVTDTDHGALVLIPQGTVAVGRVMAASLYDRVVAIEPQKVLLGGHWVALQGAAQDANGDTGMSARVNDHRGPLLVLTALAGALSGLGSAVTNQGSGVVINTTPSRPPVMQEILGGAGTAELNVVNQLVTSRLSRPPSLTIRHAVTVRLQAYTDIPLLPYCDLKLPDSRECHALDALRSNGDLSS